MMPCKLIVRALTLAEAAANALGRDWLGPW